MIYAIKFAYSFVLPPGLFVVLLLVIGFWLWRRARKQAIALLAVMLLFYLSTTLWAGEGLIGGLERWYSPPEKPQGDVIVVLGGGATGGTPNIDGSGNLSGSSANRLLTAVRLHRATGLPILFSGGQVYADTGNEADIARRELIGLGVDAKDVLVENRSLNTDQNAEYAALLLREHGFEKPILVTSAFHEPRAMLAFRNEDAKPVAYPCDYYASGESAYYAGRFIPTAEGLRLSSMALKEYLGLLATAVK